MQYRLLEQWPEIEQTDPQILYLDEVVGWKRVPTFYQPGRTGWLPLDRPIVVKGPTAFSRIEAIKIKGVGLMDKDGKISQPTTKGYYRENPHLGFNKDGTFTLVHSEVAPLGGIVLSRAQREYQNASILAEKSCPAIIPIRLYCYIDTLFQIKQGEQQPLSVVATGMPQRLPYRADTVLRYENADDEEKQYLKDVAMVLNVPVTHSPGLALMSSIVYLYGKTLRKFHEAGLYRYSGTMDNYGCCSVTGQVYLIDLDSSRLLEECSSLEKPLQIMRDVASGLFNMAAGLMDPRFIHQFSVEDIRRAGPFQSFLRGYYYDVQEDVVRSASAIFQDYYLHQHQRVLDHLPIILSDPRTIFPRYWMDRKVCYSLLMALLWFLHNASSLSKYASHHISIDQMLCNIKKFTSLEEGLFVCYQLQALSHISC